MGFKNPFPNAYDIHKTIRIREKSILHFPKLVKISFSLNFCFPKENSLIHFHFPTSSFTSLFLKTKFIYLLKFSFPTSSNIRLPLYSSAYSFSLIDPLFGVHSIKISFTSIPSSFNSFLRIRSPYSYSSLLILRVPTSSFLLTFQHFSSSSVPFPDISLFL